MPEKEGEEKPEKSVRAVPETVEVETEDGDIVEVYPVATVREPFVHTVGRQALSFGMAFVAERLSNITYDAILKAWRNRKTY